MIGDKITHIESVSISSRIFQKKLCIVKTITVIEGTANSKKALLEVNLLRHLQAKHPHIINVIHILEKTTKVSVDVYSNESYAPVKDQAYQIQYDIIMPYFRRGSLDKYLKIIQEDQLDLIATEIYRQVLLAVQFLHSCQFVHGSIKTDNIILDDNGNVKLIDFGDSALIGDYNIVSPLDDFQFCIRPPISTTIHLYNFLSGFDSAEIDESNMGLLSLFRQLFINYKVNLKHLEFYQYMLKLYNERNPHITTLLLQHPFIANPKNRANIKLLFQSKKIPFSANFHPVKSELTKVHSSLNRQDQLQRKKLYLELLHLTKSNAHFPLKSSFEKHYANLTFEDFSNLTTEPLLGRPPKGFHRLYIEFPLRKSTEKIQYYQEKLQYFFAAYATFFKDVHFKTICSCCKRSL